MNLRLLIEEFVKGVKHDDDYFEIFSNPTFNEIKKIESFPYFRFIADDKNKKVYVFNSNLLHSYAAKNLNIFTYYIPTDEYLFGEGVASVKSKKIIGDRMFFLEAAIHDKLPIAKKVLKKDWSWVNKYVDINKIMREYREGI